MCFKTATDNKVSYFSSIQIEHPNTNVNEIQVSIFDKDGNYGGAIKLYEPDNFYIDTTLKLYFTNYEGFEDFYNAVIQLKEGIDKYLAGR